MLDVLAEDGDIVQDFLIPNVRAFQWWYRTLNLRVAPSDDDRSSPHREAGAAALTARSRYADHPSPQARSGGDHHAVLDQDLPASRLRRRRGDALCKPAAALGNLTDPPQANIAGMQ